MATPRIRNRFSGQGDAIKDPGVQKWINVFGDVQIIKNMDRLKTSMQRKAARKAIAKGLQPIAQMAKMLAAEKTGLLKKSIKTKVTKMVSGKVFVDPKVFAVKSELTGGEFKEVKVKGGAAKFGNQKIQNKIKKIHGSDSTIKRPSKYAHLVEFGTSKMAAKPFMRPAMQIGRTRALNAIAAEIKKELGLT